MLTRRRLRGQNVAIGVFATLMTLAITPGSAAQDLEIALEEVASGFATSTTSIGRSPRSGSVTRRTKGSIGSTSMMSRTASSSSGVSGTSPTTRLRQAARKCGAAPLRTRQASSPRQEPPPTLPSSAAACSSTVTDSAAARGKQLVELRLDRVARHHPRQREVDRHRKEHHQQHDAEAARDIIQIHGPAPSRPVLRRTSTRAVAR